MRRQVEPSEKAATEETAENDDDEDGDGNEDDDDGASRDDDALDGNRISANSGVTSRQEERVN